jgi:hypothetical protein
MFGEDLEEAQQLTALCEEAELYLASFAWCDGIRNAYFGLGVSDFVGIFLFEILPSDASRGSFHWVVAGDIPPASLSVDRCSDSALALRLYIEEMKSWCQAVLEERPVGDPRQFAGDGGQRARVDGTDGIPGIGRAEQLPADQLSEILLELRGLRCAGIQLRLRGGVQFPTGGKDSNVQARERLPGGIGQGQQTWCDSRADGIVRMKEDVRCCAWFLFALAARVAAPIRLPWSVFR